MKAHWWLCAGLVRLLIRSRLANHLMYVHYECFISYILFDSLLFHSFRYWKYSKDLIQKEKLINEIAENQIEYNKIGKINSSIRITKVSNSIRICKISNLIRISKKLVRNKISACPFVPSGNSCCGDTHIRTKLWPGMDPVRLSGCVHKSKIHHHWQD